MPSGLPPPASIPSIIADLFQNECFEQKDVDQVLTFSNVRLTPAQILLLTYPEGIRPLDIYILQQTDSYVDCEAGSTSLTLVSFAQRSCDAHIYGYYFTIGGQERFHVRELIDSDAAIALLPTATFTFDNYVEVYNRIDKRTVILGNSSNPNYSTLQFSECQRYYYQALDTAGIMDPNIPIAHLQGLSDNLKKFVCHSD